jgi:peroxiredoxin Q/BCP
MATVKPGERAPDFSLLTDTGETVRLGDLRGKFVVLFFFVKANTPG